MSEPVANLYRVVRRTWTTRNGNAVKALILQPIGRVEHVQDGGAKPGVSAKLASETPALPSQLDEVESGLYRRTYGKKSTS